MWVEAHLKTRLVFVETLLLPAIRYKTTVQIAAETRGLLRETETPAEAPPPRRYSSRLGGFLWFANTDT